MILNYPDYIYEGWHTTLIGYATVLIPLIFNIYARTTLRAIEIIGAILHIIFFIVFVVVLITLGGRNSAEYVFTANSGGVSGWESPAIQWCIGLLSAVFPLTGKLASMVYLDPELNIVNSFRWCAPSEYVSSIQRKRYQSH